jgi:hypothetical protein
MHEVANEKTMICRSSCAYASSKSDARVDQKNSTSSLESTVAIHGRVIPYHFNQKISVTDSKFGVVSALDENTQLVEF